MGNQVLRLDALIKTSLFSLTLVFMVAAVAWYLMQPEPHARAPHPTAAIAEVSQSMDDSSQTTDPVAHHTRSQPHETAPASKPSKYSQQRSFSFHYLDILEWLFAGKRDAPNAVPHRPSASTLSFG